MYGWIVSWARGDEDTTPDSILSCADGRKLGRLIKEIGHFRRMLRNQAWAITTSLIFILAIMVRVVKARDGFTLCLSQSSLYF